MLFQIHIEHTTISGCLRRQQERAESCHFFSALRLATGRAVSNSTTVFLRNEEAVNVS
jgi:hypothetical protein